MTSLLINSAKIAKNTITAYTRNALEISSRLNIDIVSTIEDVQNLNRNNYDTFIIVGAAFYQKTAEIEGWIRSGEVKKIIWINNEYQVSPNSEYARLLKDYQSHVISNVVEKANKVKGYDQFTHINLNVLLFDDIERPIYKKYDLIYYGTYRIGRRIYLQKYFQNSNHYISSSKKNLRRIHQLCGVNARFCDKLGWREREESLNLFKYSLYLEDEFTHNHFNYLANRFYEALKCNVVQFFDSSCAETIKLSGYHVDKKYMVSDKKELEEKIKLFDFKECLLEQQLSFKNKAIYEKKEVLKCLSAHLTKS
jgi:hypothetical protein